MIYIVLMGDLSHPSTKEVAYDAQGKLPSSSMMFSTKFRKGDLREAEA